MRASVTAPIRRRAGVPHGPLNTVLQAIATPLVQETGMAAGVETPEGSYRVVRSVGFIMSAYSTKGGSDRPFATPAALA